MPIRAISKLSVSARRLIFYVLSIGSLTILLAISLQAAPHVEASDSHTNTSATDSSTRSVQMIDCAVQPYAVSDTSTLNDAIACFNTATVAGSYAISFTSDITLTLASTTVDNATANTVLQINGNGFTLDGGSSTRGLTIEADTHATIDSLTVRNGNGRNGSTTDGNGNATDHRGGGILNSGILTVTNSTVSNNSITNRGGGLYNVEGMLTIIDSTISDNSAENRGGGIYNLNGTLTISNSVISNNSTEARGGGIYTNNSSAGTMTISHSTIHNNSADTFAAIPGENGGTAVSGAGGGIHTLGDGAQPGIKISNSTIRDNSVAFAAAAVYSQDAMLIMNSTFSNNLGRFNDFGGIHSFDDGMTIINSTVESKQAAFSNLISAGDNSTGVILTNVILIGNGVRPNCSGNVTANANSLSANTYTDRTCIGATVIADLPLNPLADNGNTETAGSSVGGSTAAVVQTMALPADSPAIDAGDSATCVATDQRGEPRSDHNCDVGAFELQYADSDTVIKSNLTRNSEYSFGPTLIKASWAPNRAVSNDPGTITVTKVISLPDHTLIDGEMMVMWDISAETNQNLNIDASFCYTDAELATMPGSFDEDDLQLWRRPSGGSWQPVVSTPDLANNCLVASGVSAFSQWAVAAVTPTAVELDFFAASANADGTVSVNWATASEVNHAGFNIYRRAADSRDAWVKVSDQLIASRGAQGQGADYAFIDTTVTVGSWEYLLEDIETSGASYRHVEAIAQVTLASAPTAVALLGNSAETPLVSALLMLTVALLLVAMVVVRNRDLPRR